MPITIFVNPISGDIAVEWACDEPVLISRLKQLIQIGFRFLPTEEIGEVAGEVAANDIYGRDRDISDLVEAGLVRVINLHGGWEAKTADPLPAEEAAVTDNIAIRAASIRSSRRIDG
jgi:hypothetical protein